MEALMKTTRAIAERGVQAGGRPGTVKLSAVMLKDKVSLTATERPEFTMLALKAELLTYCRAVTVAIRPTGSIVPLRRNTPRGETAAMKIELPLGRRNVTSQPPA